MLLLRQKMADHIAIIQQEKDDGFPETGFSPFPKGPHGSERHSGNVPAAKPQCHQAAEPKAKHRIGGGLGNGGNGDFRSGQIAFVAADARPGTAKA